MQKCKFDGFVNVQGYLIHYASIPRFKSLGVVGTRLRSRVQRVHDLLQPGAIFLKNALSFLSLWHAASEDLVREKQALPDWELGVKLRLETSAWNFLSWL